MKQIYLQPEILVLDMELDTYIAIPSIQRGPAPGGDRQGQPGQGSADDIAESPGRDNLLPVISTDDWDY